MSERTNGGRKPDGRSSIYFSESDGKWHGWVTMGVKADGSPDRRHRQGKTEAEVTKKVRELERKRDAGKLDRAGRALTVEQLMDEHLNKVCVRLVSSGKMAPRTLDDYRSKNALYIVPLLGKHRVDRLLPEHLDDAWQVLYDRGLGTGTVLKTHRILSRALRVGVRREKVGRNVAELIDAPAAGDGEIEPLSQAEARRILDAVAEQRNGSRFSLGLALGLRQGEAIGLRWRYVDLDAGTVKVWWQLQRQKCQHGCADPHACGEARHKRPCPRNCAKAKRTSGRRHVCVPKDAKGLCPPKCDRHAAQCPQRKGGGMVFAAPKGKRRRIIPLPVELVEFLRKHREAQDAERERAGDQWKEHDLLFPQPNGLPVDPRADWEAWKDVLAAANVRDARLHDARHTAGTILTEMGVHIRVIQEIMGHSDIRVTEKYSHVASALAQDGMGRMGSALWG
ncbi:site-specific integrase [Actinocorallia aurea]